MNLRLGEFFHVQFAVFIYVEPFEFGFHKGHEFRFRDFTAFISVHQEKHLLGFAFASRHFFGVNARQRFCCILRKDESA